MKKCFALLGVILMLTSTFVCISIAGAEDDPLFAQYGDYLPPIPQVDNEATIEQRTNDFWQTIQDRSDELGQLYMDWSLVDKAWFTRVAEAYRVNVKEKFVLPTENDLSEDEIILLAKEALTPIIEGDPNTLTLSMISFLSDDGYDEPIWYVRFAMEYEVRLSRNGDVLTASSMMTQTPSPNQISFEEAEKVTKKYLADNLRYTQADINEMTIDKNYYKAETLDSCDFFLFHCYPKYDDGFVSIYINADTGEVYRVDLPGLGNG